ncbi:hypothetical protein GCM10010123_36890 [Pilimelia anulata]|uniref:Aminoglycoside phosphotransferase domain-containing protein n=1 Tax=Pilimelia anulata TaxID=53371 RepID=A0A8J3BEU6_9ACTN|nr:aminoglycoside phosphotransferase family protein [Pilimelia anulata]GGK03581.1 hypothetical protein GCM10010123_36890 [Pilimelia anulata]
MPAARPRAAAVQRALDRFGLGRLTGLAPLAGGSFGQNHAVDTDRGRWVLRGPPHTDRQLPTEAHFAGLLARHGLPAPWPYHVDPRADLLGWPYALMPLLPGRTAGDPATRAATGGSAADAGPVAALLGATLAALHAVPGPHPGRWQPGRGVRPLDPVTELAWWGRPDPAAAARAPRIGYGERARRRTRHRLAAARAHDPAGTTAADLARVGELLAAAAPALAADPYAADPAGPATVVMHDFHAGNVLVDRDPGGAWRTTGVLDFMECHYGDPEADLPRQLCAYLDEDPAGGLARAFVGGYLDRRPARPGLAARFPAYLLLDRAELWGFLCQHRRRPGGATFAGWAGHYLDLAAAAVPALGR